MTATLLLFYKRVLSPTLHAITGGLGGCRFQPTCSEYAAIAVSVHGPVRGTLMALRRVLRCNPLHRGGFDPVPEAHCGAANGAGNGVTPEFNAEAEALHLP